MQFYIYIYILMGIGIVLYGFYTIRKHRNINKALKEGNYTEEERRKVVPEILQSLINDRTMLGAAQEKLGAETIVAATQCFPIKSLKSVASGMAATAAKQVAWALVGVKARYYEQPSTNYLLLTNDNLHYLQYIEGVCEQHFVLDKFRLMNMQIKPASTKDFMIQTGSPINTQKDLEKLCFDIDGKPLEIVFHKGLYQDINQGVISNVKKLIDYQAAGNDFDEKLKKLR